MDTTIFRFLFEQKEKKCEPFPYNICPSTSHLLYVQHCECNVLPFSFYIYILNTFVFFILFSFILLATKLGVTYLGCDHPHAVVNVSLQHLVLNAYEIHTQPTSSLAFLWLLLFNSYEDYSFFSPYKLQTYLIAFALKKKHFFFLTVQNGASRNPVLATTGFPGLVVITVVKGLSVQTTMQRRNVDFD